MFFFCKQKTAYEMRISDWSSDVCSSDLTARPPAASASDTDAAPDDQRLSAHIIALGDAEEIDAARCLLCGSRAPERHHRGQRRERRLRHAGLHFLALDHDLRLGIVERFGKPRLDEAEGDAVDAHLEKIGRA